MPACCVCSTSCSLQHAGDAVTVWKACTVPACKPANMCLLHCTAPLPPCRIARFYMQPRATRRAAYARWWGVVKKEAKHYWVGGWVGLPQLPQLC